MRRSLSALDGPAKSGWCMDAVVATDLDRATAAIKLHQACRSDRCGCSCHTPSKDTDA